ncbi:uncharacterized protein cubi_00715 [Cryptosporidium ubiquitum]|uniref:Uncharacterized protein n=1 Tax=Cryptosporidium ubiquitum TaxID=857276 RepID=A0A1J4MEL3_9CRYT|nr:uncharacterized protein cubi_00715 [Cryptosporidium ubiquitum]OII71907.1 hypothetical protein cubi_00715 [Cryptosporidium ubiquitum]
MSLYVYILFLLLIGVFTRNPSSFTNVCKKESQYNLVLENVSILKVRASAPSGKFCPKCGSRILRIGCRCPPTNRPESSTPRGEESRSKRRNPKTGRATFSLMVFGPERSGPNQSLTEIKDPRVKSKLISEKQQQISSFKKSISEIKDSLDASLASFIANCNPLFTGYFSTLEDDELKEAIVEVLLNFVGIRMFEEKMPFLTDKKDLKQLMGSSGMSIEELAILLESCSELSLTLMNNFASMFDKKEKVKELRQEIEMLKS